MYNSDEIYFCIYIRTSDFSSENKTGGSIYTILEVRETIYTMLYLNAKNAEQFCHKSRPGNIFDWFFVNFQLNEESLKSFFPVREPYHDICVCVCVYLFYVDGRNQMSWDYHHKLNSNILYSQRDNIVELGCYD